MNAMKSTKPSPAVAAVTDPGRVQRVEAFNRWGQAAAGEEGALLLAYIAVALTGPTTVAEVAEGRPDLKPGSVINYASSFNRAAQVAAKLGADVTVTLIRDAAADATGRVREAVADVLQAALAEVKPLETVTKAQTRTVVRAALRAVKVKAHERAAKADAAKAAKRGTKSRDGKTGDKARAEMGTAAIASAHGPRDVYAGVRLICNNAQRMPEPEGKETAWKAGLAKLSEACELLAVFK